MKVFVMKSQNEFKRINKPIRLIIKIQIINIIWNKIIKEFKLQKIIFIQTLIN